MQSVLVISPNRAVVRRIRRAFALNAPDPALTVVESLAAARDATLSARFDVVLADLHLPDGVATELYEPTREPAFPLVLLVNEGDEGALSDLSRDGALDWVVKSPGTLSALPHIARGAVREFAQFERAQVAEDRLRHANRLIGTGRLAAVTAHEVGTPLNVARMQAQLLASRPDATDTVKQGCRTIVEQLDVITQRIRGMLDYARVGVPGRSSIALHEAVGSAVSLLRPLAIRKGVEVRLLSEPIVVHANRSEVQQVVFNLLTNALHVLEKGGHVTLRIRAELRDGARFAVTEVEDDGPGVPEAIRPSLFDAFFTTKEAGLGTGLGLSVCRDIANAHGGFLEVDSRPGCTRFLFGLPLQAPVR